MGRVLSLCFSGLVWGHLGGELDQVFARDAVTPNCSRMWRQDVQCWQGLLWVGTSAPGLEELCPKENAGGGFTVS